MNDPILIPASHIRDLRRDPPVPATPDPAFKVPVVECCGKAMECVAFNDCGEIFVFLECGSCQKQSDQYVPWPFIEDRAGEKDFEAIGIRYE